MYRTGVFATDDEVQRVKLAAARPAIMLHVAPQPSPVVHEIALKHGLPEIPGYYGMDLKTGEFLSQYKPTERKATYDGTVEGVE